MALSEIKSLSRYYDDDGKLILIMCPICFHVHWPVSARAGGSLSTNSDGTTSDVCVKCSTKEYLREALKMNA